MENIFKNGIKKNFNFIIESIKPFKLLIIGQIVTSIIWACYISIKPYILKIILNRLSIVTNSNIIEILSGPSVLYVALSLVVVIVFRFYNFLWLKLNSGLKQHIGNLLMDRMLKHSQSSFSKNFKGTLSNKIKDVMSSIPDLLKIIINQFLTIFLSFIFAIVTVATINYKFAILLSLWVFIYFAISLYFANKARPLCINSSEIRSQVVGNIIDILNNTLSITLFCSKKYESNRFDEQLEKYKISDQTRDWCFLKMFACQGISYVLYLGLSFYFLIKGFQTNEISIGDFALIITLSSSIINELWNLSNDILKFTDLISNIKQGLSIVLLNPEIINAPNAKDLKVLKGEIIFDKVIFNYIESKSIFENKTIKIKSKEKIGLVGYSGSGKTTFINLILRLYDIKDGVIEIDNQNIKEVTQESLRNSIGVIPQEAILFNRSIFENIQVGKINATEQEIVEAAKYANAHEFIINMQNGYNTIAGESGSRLSGGQRQRIAIARAFLKNAPILILDEATSQLDSITELKIQESLSKLMLNKTTIIIAHRLSTLTSMNRILVFDQGKIVEDGNHDQLINLNGLYKNLWDSQVGGFILDKNL